MRKRIMVLGLGVAGLLCVSAQAGYKEIYLPRLTLAKANISKADFQKDRDDCLGQATTERWTTTPGNASMPAFTHSIFEFAGCMADKGYHSDPKGYDTGRLWEGPF